MYAAAAAEPVATALRKRRLSMLAPRFDALKTSANSEKFAAIPVRGMHITVVASCPLALTRAALRGRQRDFR